MRPRRRQARDVLAMLAAIMPAASAWAQPATTVAARSAPVAPLRTLVTTSLQKRDVRLVEWSKAGIRVADASVPEEFAAEAARDVVASTDVLAVFALPGLPLVDSTAPEAFEEYELETPAVRAGLVRVTLVDGQRLVGTIAPAAEDADPASEAADTLVVQAGELGDVRLSLDDIAEVWMLGRPDSAEDDRQTRSTAETPAADTVLLANGDRLTGFVESIGSQIVISADSTDSKEGETTAIPLNRCRRVVLSNPRTPLDGMVAWISADGGEIHVVKASSLAATGAGETSLEIMLERADRSAVVVPTPRVVGVVPDASRVVSLSSLGVPRHEADSTRRWTRAPQVTRGAGAPLGLGDVLFPGAMKAQWTLPPGITALIGTIRLAPEARMWGECAVVLEVSGPDGTQQVWRGDFDPDRAATEVSIDLAGASERVGGAARLGVSIDPGKLGGIQDRILFEHVMLIRRPDAGPAKLPRE
ncbi:MAG: hypothetical protein GIKADHBN_00304 [Phycisphaerales bacterium]|nr:hypothetical protein [Phycisphaerales bacterium]